MGGSFLQPRDGDPRRDEQAWPRPHFLGTRASAWGHRPVPSSTRRAARGVGDGGAVATAEVPGAAVRPAVLTPPLLQVRRLTTTLPAARPRRSWRLPAAVPTSPRCPRRLRPSEALVSRRRPAAAGGGRSPHVAVPLLNLPERCLASPVLPQKPPFWGPRSPRRSPRKEKGSHCQVEEAGDGGPGDSLVLHEAGRPPGQAHRIPRGLTDVQTAGQATGSGRWLPLPPGITALRSPGPPASSSPCPPWRGGAPGEPGPRPRAAETSGTRGHLAKGGLACMRYQGPNLPT